MFLISNVNSIVIYLWNWHSYKCDKSFHSDIKRYSIWCCIITLQHHIILITLDTPHRIFLVFDKIRPQGSLSFPEDAPAYAGPDSWVHSSHLVNHSKVSSSSHESPRNHSSREYILLGGIALPPHNDDSPLRLLQTQLASDTVSITSEREAPEVVLSRGSIYLRVPDPSTPWREDQLLLPPSTK